jgi:hypothetical protein
LRQNFEDRSGSSGNSRRFEAGTMPPSGVAGFSSPDKGDGKSLESSDGEYWGSANVIVRLKLAYSAASATPGV